MQEPQLLISNMAILLSVVASSIFGSIWYGPLFGKKWAAYMNFDFSKPPARSAMFKGVLLNIIGAFLTAFVLTQTQQVWRPSVWGVGIDGSDAMYGFMSGFFTWLGFIVPMLFNLVGWENRPWGLFTLHAVYHFINLQIVAAILAHWR
jgi:hypothetical protein